MKNKDLTELGRREAMSHNRKDTNEAQTTLASEFKPYKYSEDKAMVICTYLRKGCTIQASCQAANIGRATYYRWLESIPEFKEFVNATESDVEATLLEQVKMSADWRAPAWILERRFPRRWGAKREVKLEVEQSNGTPEVLGMLQQVQSKLKTPTSTQDTDEG